MAIFGKLNKFKAQKPDLSSMANYQSANEVPLPTLQTRNVTPKEEAQRLRENHMQTFGTWEDASKNGSYAQRDWANAKVKQLEAQGKDVGEYLTLASMIGDTESPDDKAKREKRERLGEVFNSLGDVIGSAANLYYANKSGYNIDLGSVSDTHRERMAQIKAKQDALKQKQDELLMNAKLGEIKAKREEQKAEKKAQDAWEQKQKDYELKHMYELGIINARQVADLAKAKTQYEFNQKLAEIKHNYAMEQKAAPSYSDIQNQTKVVDSIQDGSGNVWTRNTKLTDKEIMALADMNEHPEKYITEEKDYFGNVTSKKTDYVSAALDAVASGIVPEDVLKRMGLKKQGGSSKKDNSLGIGIGGSNNSQNKLGIGL